jgi:hypothetical protein
MCMEIETGSFWEFIKFNYIIVVSLPSFLIYNLDV